MKKVIQFVLIFIFITAAASIFDEGWIKETIKSPESIAGWIVGCTFGTFILYYFIKGAIAVWPVLKLRFNITRPEEIGLIIVWILLMIYFFHDGLIDSSAGFGAAVLICSLSVFGFFWVWRRITNIYKRIVYGDEAFQMMNAEYFSILGISLATSMFLTSLEPGMYTREYMNFAAIVIFLLLIVFGVCFYWLYYLVKSAVRARKFKDRDMEFTEDCFIYNAALRSVKIPWSSITSIEKSETFMGISGLPSRFGPARTTEVLVIESSARKTPFAFTWPGKKKEEIIRTEAAKRGAVLKDGVQ